MDGKGIFNNGASTEGGTQVIGHLELSYEGGGKK